MHYYADRFVDADFPFKLARAEIREATDKAMGLKVFDEVGVLPRTRKADPIVCGRVIDPSKPIYHRSSPREGVTFFVAWWLDTRVL